MNADTHVIIAKTELERLFRNAFCSGVKIGLQSDTARGTREIAASFAKEIVEIIAMNCGSAKPTGVQ